MNNVHKFPCGQVKRVMLTLLIGNHYKEYINTLITPVDTAVWCVPAVHYTTLHYSIRTV